MTLARLRWLYAIQGGALGLLMPFIVPLLDERGLGAAEMGLVLGASGLVSLIAYPLWGTIADGGLGRRRTTTLTGAVAAGGGLLLIVAGSDALVLSLALSMLLMGALPWGPLSDALALETLGDGSSDYGRLRAWASIGWVVSAIAAGVAWAPLGSDLVLVAFAATALAVSASVALPAPAWPTMLSRRPSGVTASAVAPLPTAAQATAGRATPLPTTAVPGALIAHVGEPGPASDPRRLRLRRLLPVFASPVLLGFLVGLFVTSIGEHASWRYIGLRILDQGGGVLLVGLAAALPAIVEVPVFGSSRRLAARLGLRMLFVSGALIAALLILLVALAPEPWMVTALRTMEGTSYALRYMGMVLIVGVLLPRHLHAFGQSLAWFVYAGVAPIVADAAGGLIYESLGGPALFATTALVLVLGGAIVYAALSGPAFRGQAREPSMTGAGAGPGGA